MWNFLAESSKCHYWWFCCIICRWYEIAWVPRILPTALLNDEQWPKVDRWVSQKKGQRFEIWTIWGIFIWESKWCYDFTKIFALVINRCRAEALPDSDYLSLLRYLSFFSVLDNRLLADNLSQLSKVSIWLRKGWEEVFIYKYALFWSPFLLRFDSDK